MKQQYKKITMAEAEKLLRRNEKQNQYIKKIQDTLDGVNNKEDNIWIISDSSSGFSSLSLKNG